LRYHDYEPIESANGRSGVALAQREKPDLILCDVMMPELDGHGVLQALQQDPHLAFIPFIFLSAKGEKDDPQRHGWRTTCRSCEVARQCGPTNQK